jgi:DNA-binding PadR family transcriptional regulator
VPLGQVLIDNNLLNPSQLEEARQHMKKAGCSLVESLLALGVVNQAELESFLDQAPFTAGEIAETGLSAPFLMSFIMKAMYVSGIDTAPDIIEVTKLSPGVVNTILEDAKARRLLEVVGMADSRRSIYTYKITEAGRRVAAEALEQCSYAGPAPVPFDVWQQQVLKQTISRDRATPETVHAALGHLVLPPSTMRRIGPATNSARALLLYGKPGNGKTSIAESLGRAFVQTIFIPYCVEVGGQIIRVYDDAVHEAVEPARGQDPRWVRCRRPVVVTGGELTIEMLDLSFDGVTKTYEAPAHVKATGGVFIIDDFGRQRVNPEALLNRWMIPLERRVDYLTLHTGRKLQVYFDELVVFSTNMKPGELIDEAGLRRIPYKFEIAPPTQQDYAEIFRRLCKAHKLELPTEVLRYLFDEFYPATGVHISCAHPRYLIDAVLERCRFEDRPPKIDLHHVHDAVHSLVVDGAPPEPAGAPSL